MTRRRLLISTAALACGCVNGGHASNFDCYVRDVLPDGRVRLDTMSFG